MTILVTGGLGYIGSHTVVKLIQKGYHVIIIDNLYNSREIVLDRIEEITGIRPTFFHADLSVNGASQPIFRNFDIDTVIHFAAHKSVTDSIYRPIQYHENNVGGLTSLLQDMHLYGVKNLIFSSSCVVYGEPKSYPVHEEMPTQLPKTPYGTSKLICEQILKDSASQVNSIALRYFNPIGNHESGILFEDPKCHASNLIPYIQGVITGKYDKLKVYGDDYNTPDGTAIRDYIDVNDLADAHVKALYIVGNCGHKVINVGTGNGVSVMEIIKSFEYEGVIFPYEIVGRRDGDIEKIYGNIEKAKTLMGWEPKKNINDSVKSILKATQNRKKYL